MQYFKEIDVENFDTIVTKTLNYVYEKTDLTTNIPSVEWHEIPLQDFLDNVPELKTSFEKFNLVPNLIGLVIIYQPNQNKIHRDSYWHSARINFPILNCERTFTEFYSGVKFEKTFVIPYNGLSTFKIINSEQDFVFEDRVELKKATVMRVHEAHKVVMPDSNPLPRISLSVGFNIDPVFLLD